MCSASSIVSRILFFFSLLEIVTTKIDQTLLMVKVVTDTKLSAIQRHTRPIQPLHKGKRIAPGQGLLFISFELVTFVRARADNHLPAVQYHNKLSKILQIH